MPLDSIVDDISLHLSVDGDCMVIGGLNMFCFLRTGHVCFSKILLCDNSFHFGWLTFDRNSVNWSWSRLYWPKQSTTARTYSLHWCVFNNPFLTKYKTTGSIFKDFSKRSKKPQPYIFIDEHNYGHNCCLNPCITQQILLTNYTWHGDGIWPM